MPCTRCQSTFKNEICEVTCINFNITLFNVFNQYADYYHTDCRYSNQLYFIKHDILKGRDSELAHKLWAEYYIYYKTVGCTGIKLEFQ